MVGAHHDSSVAMIETPNVVDGSKHINSRDHPTHDTSKRGYPIVERGTLVDCEHCEDAHPADYSEGDIGLDVPGGGKRHNHVTCPNTGRMFAALADSRTR
jgi:hypothetical protein